MTMRMSDDDEADDDDDDYDHDDTDEYDADDGHDDDDDDAADDDDDDDDDDCDGLPGVAPHVPADPQLVADVSPRAAPLALACSREMLSLVTISQFVPRYV